MVDVIILGWDFFQPLFCRFLAVLVFIACSRVIELNSFNSFSPTGFSLTGDALKYERQRYDGW